jgi:hypothetical protein
LAVNTTIKPNYGQPALIGGLVMGVLSALPIISAGNFCCCLWVVSGGAIAAYLLQQNHPAPITPGDGALVGLLAGLAGAFVQFLVGIPIGILVAPMERAMLQRILEMSGNMPADMRDALERYSSSDAQFGVARMILLQLARLVFALFVGTIFSTIGGVIGAMVFKRDTPPGVIDIPRTS